MSKRGGRWRAGDIKLRFPLRHERQLQPRFDGVYRDEQRSIAAAFSDDGSVVFGGANGQWHVDQGQLLVTLPDADGDGAIGIDAVYLVLHPADGARPIELELRFADAGTVPE